MTPPNSVSALPPNLDLQHLTQMKQSAIDPDIGRLADNVRYHDFAKDGGKLDVSKYSHSAVDAEWCKDGFLTKQVTFSMADYKPVLTVVLWNKTYILPSNYPSIDHPLYIILIDENTSITEVLKLPSYLLLHLYYSPKDLTAFFGRETFTKLLDSKNVPLSKLRNITGNFTLDGTEYKVQDALGMFNDSLENGLKSVGIDVEKSKALAKSWDKSKMDEWITSNPDTFLMYAIGDTIDLMKAISLRTVQINKIINNALPHQLGDYTPQTIKFSSGSLVNDVFIRWFAHEYPDVFQTTLKQSQNNDNSAWKFIKDTREDLTEQNDPTTLLKLAKQLRSKNAVNGLAAGSINGIGIGRTNTGLFGTVVQGGRCINEEPHIDPYQNRVENVIDIDLSSCYGSALRNFDFPVGLPTVYGKDIDDKNLTLGEFLKRRESELVPGLYVIYVSGMLEKSSQDLVFSKYKITTVSIIKKLFTDEKATTDSPDGYGRTLDTSHMGGDFALTKKQIELGIITSDVLEVLRKVASCTELKEWMNLNVDAAVYYPKSLERSIDKWSDTINNYPGYKTAEHDSRNHCWTRFSLESFIGKFIDYRKAVKKTKVSKGDEADLLQASVKLFINTTYGCLAAPYFEIGNTVIANNITAKARTGVWMMSKALLTVQSITDGGMFSGDRVAVLSGDKLPSLSTLGNREKLIGCRGLKLVPLVDIDTKRSLIAAGNGADLDKLCREHIDKFWSCYDLTMPFDIECKYENCGDIAVYFGSSDYIIDVRSLNVKDTEGKPKQYEVKCRGAKESDHPKKLWLFHLLSPDTNSVPIVKFPYTSQIGFNDYLKNKSKYQELGVLPGDTLPAVTYHHPFKNGQTFTTLQTLENFKRSENSAEKAWCKEDKKEVFGLAAKVSNLKYPKAVDTVSA